VVEGLKRESIFVVRAETSGIVRLELLGCFDEDGWKLELNALGYFGGLFVLGEIIFVGFVLVCLVCIDVRGFVVVGAYIRKCSWWSLLTKL
jgi:hypothetical protein